MRQRSVFPLRAIVAGAIIASAGCHPEAMSPPEAETDQPPTAYQPRAAYRALGQNGGLGESYRRWRAAHEQDGGDRNVVIPLGWSKGLSDPRVRGSGVARLNLVDGQLSVEVSGLASLKAVDVWLVDNQDGAGKSVLPEDGDRFLWIGTLAEAIPDAGPLRLETSVGRALDDFEVDLVVITRTGETPQQSRLLMGSAPLFQVLYTEERTGRIHSKRCEVEEVSAKPRDAIDAVATLDRLVVQGADLFFNQTFDGNGRTCGTCHPAENNLTIDPAFIATLPPRDPLFVAEFTPALSRNFERPELMRQFGLILENTDGFEDLESRFTMRGVPHTLALPTSLQPSTVDGSTLPPNHRTGWSGDGAPGSGTLRDFALGAVVQHFTRTLERRPGIDFRLPTDAELDALEAFQRFLGRDADVSLATMLFNDPLAELGRQLFLTDGKCNGCHNNGGANIGAANFNLDTGVEDLPTPPARQLDPTIPRDGGFGSSPNAKGGFGDGRFNVPPVVEAADTGPFFHNNAVSTIEEAVEFYSGPEFNASPAGQVVGGVNLTAAQSAAIGAFLRVLNSLENIRATEEIVDFLRANERAPYTKDLLTLAIAEVNDALEVLQGPSCGLSSAAAHELAKARQKLELARKRDRDAGERYLDEAKEALVQARSELQSQAP